MINFLFNGTLKKGKFNILSFKLELWVLHVQLFYLCKKNSKPVLPLPHSERSWEHVYRTHTHCPHAFLLGFITIEIL